MRCIKKPDKLISQKATEKVGKGWALTTFQREACARWRVSEEGFAGALGSERRKIQTRTSTTMLPCVALPKAFSAPSNLHSILVSIHVKKKGRWCSGLFCGLLLFFDERGVYAYDEGYDGYCDDGVEHWRVVCGCCWLRSSCYNLVNLCLCESCGSASKVGCG